MSREVVITGIGLLSCVGDSAADLYDGVAHGRQSFKPITRFEAGSLEGLCAMEVTDFEPGHYLGDKNFRPLDRTGRLAVTAADLALKNAGWDQNDIERTEVGLVLGTVFCGLDTIMGFDHNTLTAGPKYAKPMAFANTVINAAAGQPVRVL